MAKEFNKVSKGLKIEEVSDEYLTSLREISSNNKDQKITEGNFSAVKNVKKISKLFNDKFINDYTFLIEYNKEVDKELQNIKNKECKISISNKELKEELIN